MFLGPFVIKSSRGGGLRWGVGVEFHGLCGGAFDRVRFCGHERLGGECDIGFLHG